jgi:hypothetical protein
VRIGGFEDWWSLVRQVRTPHPGPLPIGWGEGVLGSGLEGDCGGFWTGMVQEFAAGVTRDCLRLLTSSPTGFWIAAGFVCLKRGHPHAWTKEKTYRLKGSKVNKFATLGHRNEIIGRDREFQHRGK